MVYICFPRPSEMYKVLSASLHWLGAMKFLFQREISFSTQVEAIKWKTMALLATLAN